MGYRHEVKLCFKMEDRIFFSWTYLFHDSLNMILAWITIFTICIIFSALANKIINVLILAHQKLESIWILAPTLVLLKIGVPSLQLLYLGDDAVNCSVTLGVNARQWYWRYEYSDFLSPEFNSSLEFHSSIISAKNTIPISLEFLNFNQVGLISYFLHGDLNNTFTIGHSSRNNLLDLCRGRPERSELHDPWENEK